MGDYYLTDQREPVRLANFTSYMSSASTRSRMLAVDWTRGWLIILSVVADAWIVKPAWFAGGGWLELRPLDLLLPLFVAVDVWRLTGVLQLYGVMTLLLGLLHFWAKTWRGRAVNTGVFAASQLAVLTAFGSTCPAGTLTMHCNPSRMIDPRVFGANHLYLSGAVGYDTEGIVTLLGLLTTAAAGMTIGHLLRRWLVRSRETGVHSSASTRPLLFAAAGFAIAALASKYTVPLLFGVSIPVIRPLWTTPFALGVASLATVLVFANHRLLDGRATRGWVAKLSYPILAVGRNAMFIYFGSQVTTSLLEHRFGDRPPLASQFFRSLPTVGAAQTLLLLAALTVWVSLAVLLHRLPIER